MNLKRSLLLPAVAGLGNVGKPSVQIDSGTDNSVRHLMPAN